MIGNRRSRSVRFIAALLLVMIGSMAVVGYVRVNTWEGAIFAPYINSRSLTDARGVIIASHPDISMGAPQPFHYKKTWSRKGRE